MVLNRLLNLGEWVKFIFLDLLEIFQIVWFLVGFPLNTFFWWLLYGQHVVIHNQRNSNTPARQYPPFNFQEISEEFVLSQLRSLKSGKAVGFGPHTGELLKDSADIVTKPVSFIIRADHSTYLIRERLMRLTIIARFPFYLFYLRS